MSANIKYEIENTDIFLIHIWENKKKAFLNPKIDLEIKNSVKEKRSPHIYGLCFRIEKRARQCKVRLRQRQQ